MAKLVQISDFFPLHGGVCLASPGGASFDLEAVTAVVAQHGTNGHGYLDIYVMGGKEPIHCTFHRNSNDGPVPIYQIKGNIDEARNTDVEKSTPIYNPIDHRNLKPGGPLYNAALKRPANYINLSQQRQWEIDKSLGILDWDGDPNK